MANNILHFVYGLLLLLAESVIIVARRFWRIEYKSAKAISKGLFMFLCGDSGDIPNKLGKDVMRVGIF